MDDRRSILTQNILREKAIYRYTNALEQGDLDTLAIILKEAEQDELLERMIDDVHILFMKEEDRVTQAQDAAFLHQILLEHRQRENISLSTSAVEAQQNPIIATSILDKTNFSVSATTFFRRLKEIGFEKEFVLQRLLPKSLRERLQGDNEDEQHYQAILQASSLVERIFSWTPGSMASSFPLELNAGIVGSTRFKKDKRSDVSKIGGYTLYARYLAQLVLQATADLSQEGISTEPESVRHDILSKYDSISFEHTLLYVWSLGIPVLPLDDSGAFHGACWRSEGRNVIVLKQQTRSDARWLFDLLHELRHAAQDPEKRQFEVIEADALAQSQLAEEEQIASRFAGNVILDGRADQLAKMCTQEAKGSVERLKKAVPVIAQRERVPTDALANYMAFRLSHQGVNWWPTAAHLQKPSTVARETAHDVLIQHAKLELLDETDRQLLLQALSHSED